MASDLSDAEILRALVDALVTIVDDCDFCVYWVEGSRGLYPAHVMGHAWKTAVMRVIARRTYPWGPK